ncbi:hypothetical protein CDD83_9403 [Cordyceps sp. RAO-2017]|nr:hypothetical protein CDD83_9403 [Cordyceps sp. RAO-2017]
MLAASRAPSTEAECHEFPANDVSPRRLVHALASVPPCLERGRLSRQGVSNHMWRKEGAHAVPTPCVFPFVRTSAFRDVARKDGSFRMRTEAHPRTTDISISFVAGQLLSGSWPRTTDPDRFLRRALPRPEPPAGIDLVVRHPVVRRPASFQASAAAVGGGDTLPVTMDAAIRPGARVLRLRPVTDGLQGSQQSLTRTSSDRISLIRLLTPRRPPSTYCFGCSAGAQQPGPRRTLGRRNRPVQQLSRIRSSGPARLFGLCCLGPLARFDDEARHRCGCAEALAGKHRAEPLFDAHPVYPRDWHPRPASLLRPMTRFRGDQLVARLVLYFLQLSHGQPRFRDDEMRIKERRGVPSSGLLCSSNPHSTSWPSTTSNRFGSIRPRSPTANNCLRSHFLQCPEQTAASAPDLVENPDRKGRNDVTPLRLDRLAETKTMQGNRVMMNGAPRARVWRCCKCSTGWFSVILNDTCPWCSAYRCTDCEYAEQG